MYEKGRGGEKNEEKAAQLYERAYALGSKEAARRLGELYQKGRGVKRSRKTADEWLQRAGDRAADSSVRAALTTKAEKPSLLNFWMLRGFGLMFLAVAYWIGNNGLNRHSPDYASIKVALMVGLMVLLCCFSARFYEPPARRRAPR